MEAKRIPAEGPFRSKGREGARAWSMFGDWKYRSIEGVTHTGGSEGGEAGACGGPQRLPSVVRGGQGAWAEGLGGREL